MDRRSFSEVRKAARVIRDASLGELYSDVRFLTRVKQLEYTHRLTGKSKRGTCVYEHDWDVLVILDACRLDIMRAVDHDYDFIDDVDVLRSVGSHSREWMEHTFFDRYTADAEDTAYITGNPFSDGVLTDDMFAELDEVWKYAWDDDLGTIPPRPLTDRAIDYWRTDDRADKMIVHYMQPHAPFIPDPDLGQGMTTDEWGYLNRGEVWRNLRLGRVDYADVLDGYEANLRHVLDDVALLLNNLDADTVAITADHGNAVGEANMYGHPYGVSIDVLRDVPYITTTGTDERTHTPAQQDTNERGDLDDKLEALGYK